MLADVTQALKDTENALRDFIAMVLEKSFGTTWIEKCGVAPDRIEKWKERQVIEQKRQESGVVEERLIYYADFYDLRTILKKHWSGELSKAFGDWKTMEVWLSELEKLRDPDAHRRELLPHQKHLVAGIAGEIRTRMVRYRSKQETTEDVFPRIESARDSLGNIVTGGADQIIRTGMVLRVGDDVDFVITASDPSGAELEYALITNRWDSDLHWQKSNVLSLKFQKQYIGKGTLVQLLILSNRDYHANNQWDDRAMFEYDVIPAIS